jgi:hypothetical protein
MATFITAVGAVVGDMDVISQSTTTYVDFPDGHYVRVVQEATQHTLTVSTNSSIVSETKVPTTGHPDGVAAALAGVVYRAGVRSGPLLSSSLMPTEWPPGRLTSFALMLSTQTHAASAHPFARTNLTEFSSTWTRADRLRTICTVYKADYLELTDTLSRAGISGLTVVVGYPVGLTYGAGGWECRQSLLLVELLGDLWRHLAGLSK